MVLKLAKSFAHAMILAVLPYLQWKFMKQCGPEAGKIIAHWFKPAARSHVEDAYWDRQE